MALLADAAVERRPRPPLRRALRLLWPRLIKKWLPRSLFGRSLLIVVLPIVLMQGAVVWGFFEAHLNAVGEQLCSGLAGDVAADVQDYEAAPTPATLARIAGRAERLQALSITLQPGVAVPREKRRTLLPHDDTILDRALNDRLDEAVWVDTTRYPAYVDIRVAVQGGALRIIAPRDRVYAARGPAFVIELLIATLILTGVAILFIRNQVRSIERLASAAEAFGKGEDAPRFHPHGAREVREAGHAFLDMRARIQRHIEQRTTLLAAVSHDLRTPLTRLKLAVALAEPSPRIEAIKGDLAEMEHMVEEYLDFARGEGGEAVEPVEVAALLAQVAEAAGRSGATVELAAPPAPLPARLRPNAVKRALSNLLMNAAAHGSGRVRLDAHRGEDGALEVAVDDDGPGIPDDLHEEAFKPFSRLDPSRRNAKGVGLGLAIARDVARGHGGDITLSRSPLGGLRATLRLPG
jgi:two-component system, OmpR family, osmolarity sensor histidine kinase EnvZ